MKVRELKNFLELQMDEPKARDSLNRFSHWITAIFQAKEYVTSNPKDVTMLERLKDLNIISLRVEKSQYIAELTSVGRKLYQDFYAHGYY